MKSNNPSAFPLNEFAYNINNCGGMTLRDYFAAKAISGFTSAFNQDGEWTSVGCETDIAQYAYNIADAMLKQREL